MGNHDYCMDSTCPGSGLVHPAHAATKDSPVGYFGPAGDLLATLVQANVDSLAATNRRLHEGLEREVRRFAEHLLEIYNALEAIPDHSRSVVIERILEKHSFIASAAENLLKEPEAN